jgi:hypothetical protein
LFERIKKALVGRQDDVRPGSYSVAGILATCPHCKGSHFSFGTARARLVEGLQLATLLGRTIYYTLTCNVCRHVDHFAERPKRGQQTGRQRCSCDLLGTIAIGGQNE